MQKVQVGLVVLCSLVAVGLAHQNPPNPSPVWGDDEFLAASLAEFPLRDYITTGITTDANGDLIDFYFSFPDYFGNVTANDTLIDCATNGYALFPANFAVAPFPEHPDLPFTHNAFFYNPCGHDGPGWNVTHFDNHFYLVSEEFIQAIAINTIPTADQLARFAEAPVSQYLPLNYTTDPSLYVPNMGAHYYNGYWAQTGQLTNALFEQQPAYLYMGFDGEVIGHEPMITLDIFEAVKANGTQAFSWPQPTAWAKPGKYFQTLQVEYAAPSGNNTFGIYTVRGTDLFHAPEYYKGFDVFQGSQISSISQLTSASSSKNCIAVDQFQPFVDAGFEVTDVDGNTFCCLSRGVYNSGAGSCDFGCAGASSVLSGLTYDTSTSVCYFRCYTLN